MGRAKGTFKKCLFFSKSRMGPFSGQNKRHFSKVPDFSKSRMGPFSGQKKGTKNRVNIPSALEGEDVYI